MAHAAPAARSRRAPGARRRRRLDVVVASAAAVVVAPGRAPTARRRGPRSRRPRRRSSAATSSRCRPRTARSATPTAAPSSTGWPGTVTWLPRAGSVVRTNRRLYEVDGKAVYLLDGSGPAYRDLGAGTTGNDVRALERNLRELGKDPSGAMRVDGTWDARHDRGRQALAARQGARADRHDRAGPRRVRARRPARVVAGAEGRRERRHGIGRRRRANQPAFYDGADASAASSVIALRSAATTTTTRGRDRAADDHTPAAHDDHAARRRRRRRDHDATAATRAHDSRARGTTQPAAERRPPPRHPATPQARRGSTRRPSARRRGRGRRDGASATADADAGERRRLRLEPSRRSS